MPTPVPTPSPTALRLETILHPTDFSPSAAQALRMATRLAASHAARLHLFHATTPHDDQRADAEAFERYVATARGLLEAAGNDAVRRLEVHAERAVLPFDAIMRVAEVQRPDVIVLGTHGRAGVPRLLMGSTAEKVLRHAPGHVMTVRAATRVPETGRFDTLLVPIDFSPWASRALDGARALCQPGGTVYLTHVVEPLPALYYAGRVSSRFELDPDLRARVEDGLRRWVGELGDDTEPTIVVTEGNPALEVVRLADELGVDLVVMSTKGLTGVEHLLVGSVTERVCRFANVPVLTVRT